jgi:RHS repeat-associated protein
MGARRYSASTGRFLQYDLFADALDNLGLSENPLSQNRYALAGGNPINFVEVDGHAVGNVPTVGEGGANLRRLFDATCNWTTCTSYDGAKYLPGGGPGGGGGLLNLLIEVSGVKDVVGCLEGDISACAWAVAGVTPVGKATKAAKAAKAAKGAKRSRQINAADGQRIVGFTSHGVDRAIGDMAKRAGVKPRAIVDAVRNPKRITKGVDDKGRPFKVYYGADARVVVNPRTGRIVSVNPRSRRGANR